MRWIAGVRVAVALALIGVLLGQTPLPQVLGRGKVVDGEGRPVAGVSVAGSLRANGNYSSYRTTSDANGEFVISVRNTSAYTLLRFGAWAPGYSSSETVVMPPMGDPAYKDLTLTLRPTVDFAVLVVDGAGTPVAGAKVVLRDSPAGAPKGESL